MPTYTQTPTMLTLHPYGATLLSGFSAPQAPKYSGYTMEARKTFSLEYAEYMRAVADASASTGMKIQARPISTCIEGSAKAFVAKHEIQKSL
jgi:hypothetical protein